MAENEVPASAAQPDVEMSKDEQIGFHKGSISVLAKEREELTRIVTIVDQLMQMHVKALGELGVDLSQMQAQATEESKEHPKKNVPIENLI
jgi:hypothetical protein